MYLANLYRPMVKVYFPSPIFAVGIKPLMMSIRMKFKAIYYYKSLIINLLSLLLLVLTCSCAQNAKMEENSLGIGLVTHLVDVQTSKCTLVLMDKGINIAEFRIPIRKGLFVTDSSIVAGGSVMLEVRKAELVSKGDSTSNAWLKQLRAYYSVGTDSSLIFKLNLVSPVPILPNHLDSGHTQNATHIITATIDKGDTSNQFTFRIGLRGMPQKIDFEAIAHCNPGLFGIAPNPKGPLAKFMLTLKAAPEKK